MTHALPRWFQFAKYAVYGLLVLNVYLFLQEELVTIEHLFAEGIRADLLIQAFSATIDTAAWVILLLTFELETYVIPDERLRGGLKRSLHGLRAFCYLFIVYACYGYIVEMLHYYRVSPLHLTDACALLGQGYSVLVDLDHFEALTADNCAALGRELWQVGSAPVIASTGDLQSTRWLAWTDVVNSTTWIGVVLLLEFDVRMQLRGAYTGRVLRTSKALKVVLYSVLFGAATYWGFEGSFLDFWDAFLWLLAFFCIEQNLFAWQRETQAELEGLAHPV